MYELFDATLPADRAIHQGPYTRIGADALEHRRRALDVVSLGQLAGGAVRLPSNPVRQMWKQIGTRLPDIVAREQPVGSALHLVERESERLQIPPQLPRPS